MGRGSGSEQAGAAVARGLLFGARSGTGPRPAIDYHAEKLNTHTKAALDEIVSAMDQGKPQAALKLIAQLVKAGPLPPVVLKLRDQLLFDEVSERYPQHYSMRETRWQSYQHELPKGAHAELLTQATETFTTLAESGERLSAKALHGFWFEEPYLRPEHPYHEAVVHRGIGQTFKALDRNRNDYWVDHGFLPALTRALRNGETSPELDAAVRLIGEHVTQGKNKSWHPWKITRKIDGSWLRRGEKWPSATGYLNDFLDKTGIYLHQKERDAIHKRAAEKIQEKIREHAAHNELTRVGLEQLGRQVVCHEMDKRMAASAARSDDSKRILTRMMNYVRDDQQEVKAAWIASGRPLPKEAVEKALAVYHQLPDPNLPRREQHATVRMSVVLNDELRRRLTK